MAEYEGGQAIEYDMPENEAGRSGTLAVVVGGALLAGFALAAAVLQRRNR